VGRPSAKLPEALAGRAKAASCAAEGCHGGTARGAIRSGVSAKGPV
jgi:hypothetical protein